MDRWFPIKNELLYDYTIKAKTKILLAVLWHHRNNNNIVNKTVRELDVLANIKRSDRYLNELIKLGHVEKIKDGQYKLKYYVKCKKGSEDRYSKIKIENILKYKPDDVINQCIIENILRMNKLSLDNINKIDETIFLSINNNKSPWNTLEEVKKVLNSLNEQKIINYEATIKCLVIMTADKNEQEKTAPKEKEAVLDKEVSDNIIQKTETKITNNLNEFEEFFGKERTEQLIIIAKKNEIEITLENLSILHNYKTKAQKNDTAESLVDYFYQKTETKNTLQNITNYVKKMNGYIEKYGFIKTRYLIDYAIEQKQKVNSINFLNNIYENAYGYILNRINDEIDIIKAECSNKAMNLKELRIQAEQIKQQYNEESEQYQEIKVKYNTLYNEFKNTEAKKENLENILKGD